MTHGPKGSPRLQAFGDLIIALTDRLPMGVVDARGDTWVAVTGVDLNLPLETRLDHGAEVRASLPRGRYATGFQMPHGRITARFEAQVTPVAPVDRGRAP